MNAPIETLLPRLQRVREIRSGQFLASCPGPLHIHGDRHPSLSVAVGDDGRVLLHCWAGCEVAAVVAALGLTLGDLFPPRRDGAHHRRPQPMTPPWRDLVRLLLFEARVLVEIWRDRDAGQPLTPETLAREHEAFVTIERIRGACRGHV